MLQVLFAVVVLSQPVPAEATDAPLLTAAERSDYQATSTHAEVVEFCRELAGRSPRVRLRSLGRSAKGRDLPLLIVADPPLASAAQAARQVQAGKLLVYAQGNIHAGEVCGKEALLMLARDLAAANDAPLLNDIVLVIAPIFNADGNEPFDPANRPGQHGPAGGVGQRGNAQGLDLNRDHVKLESPEVRALARFLNRWNPALVIDTHTTNGSRHRYALTYDSPRHPATDAKLLAFARDELLPDAGRRMQQAEGYRSFYYGNFDRGHARWETYPAQPRYNTQYVGLRQRIGILSEAYAYAPYRDRVLATRSFVHSCLQAAAARKKEIAGLLKAARQRAAAKVAIASRPAPLGSKHTVLGYAAGEGEAAPQPRDYEVQYFGVAEPAVEVARPAAYLVPAECKSVLENLQRHGVQLHELREDVELDVEAYRIERLTRSEKPFQHHHLVQLEVTAAARTERVAAGTVVVQTAQPLGALAVNLLEPAAEDGLATWNFFDESLTEGGEFPVLRLPARAPLLLAPLESTFAENAQRKKKPISFEAVSGRSRPNFSGAPVSGFRWLDDEHYLLPREGKLWKVHAESGRSERFFDPAALRGPLEKLPTIDAKAAARLAQQAMRRMNAQRTAALLEHGDDLYFATLDGKSIVRLTSTPGREELASFSPDGRFVAFVRNYDLCVVDLETRTERALTTGGSTLVRHGKADWVYYEEYFHRDWSAYKWSPDSSRIAFLRFDDGPVGEFNVVDEVPVRQNVERQRYPKAGDPNPRVALGVANIAGDDVVWADLSGYSPDGLLIAHFGWLPGSDGVYFYAQNRAQTWLDFNVVDEQGDLRRLFREASDFWVDNPGEPTFLADGSFLLTSERSGWNHLYRFASDGRLLRRLTDGDWEVRQLETVDEEGGWVYFSGTRDSHIAGNYYRVKLAGKEEAAAGDGGAEETRIERLTTGPGSHRVSVAPGGKLFVDSRSDRGTPTRVALYRGDGERVRTLDTNPVPDLKRYEFGALEFHQIKTSDGFLLEATLLKPPGFDPAKKYPVWFMTYGGPHAPTVFDGWHGGRVNEQMLAQLGILVFRCDPRSASGKGACSARAAYRQLGVQELKDVEEAIGWLAAKPFVDAARIGMSGHSYGGFLTTYCLTHSKLFCAGIAGAPVTDWRNYDTIYTERYMDTPQENPEGYERTSVVAAAENLHGRLLLLHGGIDDNVHLQNTLQLAGALQRANKQFELMIYPKSRHGLYGPHYQRLVYDFIRRNLKP